MSSSSCRRRNTSLQLFNLLVLFSQKPVLLFNLNSLGSQFLLGNGLGFSGKVEFLFQFHFHSLVFNRLQKTVEINNIAFHTNIEHIIRVFQFVLLTKGDLT